MKDRAALKKWLCEDRSALSSAVTACIGDHVRSLRSRGIDFYGYALLPGDVYDVNSLVAVVNSESDIKVPPGDREYRYYRYSVDEWKYWEHDGFERADQILADLNRQFQNMYTRDSDDDLDDEIAHSEKSFEAILRGMEAARANGLFGRDDPFLAMWISDSSHDIIFESVKRLNCKLVVGEFMAEFG